VFSKKIKEYLVNVKMINLSRQNFHFSIARFTPLHPKETVRNILLGKQFSLEFYKSLADKIALLSEATASGDGNAITVVNL